MVCLMHGLFVNTMDKFTNGNVVYRNQNRNHILNFQKTKIRKTNKNVDNLYKNIQIWTLLICRI